MELKFGNYVWWGNDNEEKLYGDILRIIPNIDQKTGKVKQTKDGKNKYLIIVDSSEHNQEVQVTIIESQRVFWDKQIGKHGIITHNPINNYLTFDELNTGKQSTLADYDPDIAEMSLGEEEMLSREVLEQIRNDYEKEIGEIKRRLGAVNYALEQLSR